MFEERGIYQSGLQAVVYLVHQWLCTNGKSKNLVDKFSPWRWIAQLFLRTQRNHWAQKMFLLHVCMCAQAPTCLISGGENGSQMVASCHVSARNQAPGPLGQQPVLLATEPFLQPSLVLHFQCTAPLWASSHHWKSWHSMFLFDFKMNLFSFLSSVSMKSWSQQTHH